MTTIIVVDYSPTASQLLSSCRVRYYQCDVSDSAAIKALCTRIKSEVGSPTVLVNNAGLTRGSTVSDGSYQDVEMTFRTNIIAPFLLAKEFLPHMVARNHGHIIGIASMSAIISPTGLADYAATKAGLMTMQETVRQELRYKHNALKVRVSTAVL
ncbi:hypothetical protein H2198_004264 [Neophaeococcomyces mojaviensis]|uniref:Uncharacterized protein n=1 Tax=Neophaeococcomyces mojaviensis TaxID=3383035 RepID=A0ACC3A9C3_9EURO|nr:hypothetical protein H2198_004264 [Knufia sp. JES_112]